MAGTSPQAKRVPAVLPDLAAENKRLQAELAAMREQIAAKSKVTLKKSAKGALSAYGLGRWPVTLYASQWIALLDQTHDGKAIREFIVANKLPMTKEEAAS